MLALSECMKSQCPKCPVSTAHCPKVVRKGGFFRKSDSRWIQRYYCQSCRKHFSQATFSDCFGQKKRRINEPLRRLICSRSALRRAAILLRVNRKTIARRVKFLAARAERMLQEDLIAYPPSDWLQMDELETSEHTKCKPLSVPMMVENKTRRILGFEVARMPAKCHLAKLARKKYGPRKDERAKARRDLLTKLAPHLPRSVRVDSDEHPHYAKDLERYLPGVDHRSFKGKRACVAGQGEMKQGGFDPLFSINHTFACCRDNMNRLTRRTWATTKTIEGLRNHLLIYAQYHNSFLIKNKAR
jgi:transposase-like protein